MTLAFAWSGLGRSMPVQNWKPVRPPEEHTLVWLLWPSTPHEARTRSVKPSSPGRPRWTMISFWRPSTMALRSRAAMLSSASSHVARSHLPSSFPCAPQWVQDPVGVGYLVDGRRPLGAVAPSRPWVLGVPLELAHLVGFPVDICQKATSRLAVEAGRRHQHRVVLDPPRPCARAQLDPVVPALRGREGG